MLSGAPLEPKLLSLSESTGSAYGTRFVATVVGAGLSDSLTLIDSTNGQSICETSKMLAYNQLECVTKAQEILTSTILSVKDTISNTVFTCGSANTQDCAYQTLSNAASPIQTSAVKTDATTLTITGSNLQITNYAECSLTFAEV